MKAASHLTGNTTAAGGNAADIPDDPRLLSAVQEYLRELEAGRTPDRQALLRRHPDLAAALAECLDGLDLVHCAGAREKLILRADSPQPTEQTDNPAANPLGDFKLVREIGRGGMGIVYEAIQLSLGRPVAVKVLPLAATFDSKLLQRFRNEAQAAAQLHHTNIVPVYAVGCERGVHFYAMQLIEGQSLSVVIDQMRLESGRASPEEAASVAARRAANAAANGDQTPAQRAEAAGAVETTGLRAARTKTESQLALATQRSGKRRDFFRTAARLMVQAADGLEHAHQFGIVHRDVKPANLLVDAHGRLWITDFGVAQFHAQDGLTQTGDMLGTLRYMSPEQTSGQRGLSDPRSDVYSLGVTLYELVTLEHIFPGRNRHELLEQIIHHEPRPPRSLDPAIPVELETIILKAVAKNPSERYASAREFAADLERYLNDQPILAKRPSLIERSRKWLRRHPSVLVSAITLLVLIAAGSSLAAWLIHGAQEKTQRAYELERERAEEVRAEQKKAELAFKRERDRAEEAEKNFRQHKKSVDDMIQLAEQELADTPHLQSLRKRILEIALSYYQEFIEQRRDEPDAPELAATHDHVKKILADLSVMQGDANLYLLNEPDVLDDLAVDPPQREQLASLLRRQAEKRHETFQQFHKLPADERRSRFLELAQANEIALSILLSKEQIRRLHQIALQARGLLALVDVDIAAALKLTTAQRERIRGIASETFFARTDVFFKGPMPKFERPPGGKGDRPPPGKMERPPPRKLDTVAVNERLQGILTPEQFARWNEMIGPVFKGRISHGPPGPSGPPFGMPPLGPR